MYHTLEIGYRLVAVDIYISPTCLQNFGLLFCLMTYQLLWVTWYQMFLYTWFISRSNNSIENKKKFYSLENKFGFKDICFVDGLCFVIIFQYP